jgi:MHS family proline/betaine transporter-like MFS transporter
VAFNAIAFNLAFLYIVHWLQEVDGIAPARTLQINTISMLAIMPVSLTMGWLSDHIGRRTILLIAATIGIVGAVPFFALMHSTSTLMILLGQFGFVIAVGMAFGVMPALTTETTPLDVRCTALALGNNISYSILGGTMPLAATWLVYRTGNDYSPAYLIMAAAAFTFVAALCHPESYHADFKTLASKPA